MDILNKKVHGLVFFESYCNLCKTRLIKKVHDYGHITLKNLDEKIGHTDFTLAPLRCDKCGKRWPPKYLILADGGLDTIITRLEIGSERLPVVGNDNEHTQEYGNVRSPEEQEEFERGLAKMEDYFLANKKDFWESYVQWAFEDWQSLVKDLNPMEIRHGFDLLELPPPPENMSSTALKKLVLKALTTAEEKHDFWCAANRHIVYDWFLWLPPDQWPIQELIQRFGLERVRYLVFNFPLPEELEKYRTALMPLVIKKTGKETGILFARIGQLGQELDKQRRRAQQLASRIDELKRENTVLNTRLAETNLRIQELEEKLTQAAPVTRDPEDQRRILRLKGLVQELRAEVQRLAELVPSGEAESAAEEPPEQPLPEPELNKINQEPIIATIKDKTIAVFGKPSPGIELPYKILWHHGDKIDQEMEDYLRAADVYIILTRLVAHKVMWRVKEEAANSGKPAAYIRETGVKRILEHAARCIAQQNAQE
jgi:hypothetical protein